MVAGPAVVELWPGWVLAVGGWWPGPAATQLWPRCLAVEPERLRQKCRVSPKTAKCVCTRNTLPRLNSCRPGQPSPHYSLPQPMRSFSSCPGQSACSLQDPRSERLPCTHKGTYADDCICERVKQHRCYIVATCDRDLRRWAAQRSIAQRCAAQRGWSCSGTGQCSKQGLMAV